MTVIKLVARKELISLFKSYWFVFVAFLFFILNEGLLQFGIYFSGSSGHINPRAVMLSLIHLEMYLMPLLAFILSYDGMLKERELGTLDLLLSYPLVSADLVLGKWIGFTLMLSFSFLLGFVAPAIHLWILGFPLSDLIVFSINAIGLGVAFISMGLLISTISKDRTIVIAMCIILWVFYIFFFDLGFVGLAILSNGETTENAISWVLLLNPADVFRLVAISSLLSNDASVFFGIGNGALQLPYGIFVMLLWIGLPLRLAMNKNFLLSRGVS
ncbi:MAG: ABC transporter permease subunit [Legionellales bacterium]|nr:ABC transporter permease subunit [Legionellales bacterium]